MGTEETEACEDSCLSTEACNALAIALEARLPAEARVAIREFMERTPEAEALLRHVATVPFRRQRFRLFLEWLPQIKYDSDFYPLDAEWFASNVAPKLQPSEKVLWWHKIGLWKQNITIFSHVNPNDGLLRRNIFNVVVDTENITPEDFQLAYKTQDDIISNGGISTLRQKPEIRWNTINIVVGPIRQAWARFFLKLYSLKLVTDALSTKKFDLDKLESYRIHQPEPPNLNIAYIAKLT